jgi:transcriptional regulator with XRE-family HTH domain
MIVTAKDNELTDISSAELLTAAVAARVRSLRTGRAWSLDELAGRSGVSKGMLVQIEGARTNPSLATLCRIADAFGVSMTQLLEPATERAVHIADVANAPRLWRGPDGGSGRLLGGVGGANVVELWTWELAAGEEHVSPDHAPGSRELVHVLAGTVTVTVDGTPYVVHSGQTIEYLSDRPHAYRNSGRALCRMEMMVTLPAGEHDRRR